MSYTITKPDAGPSPALDAVNIRNNFSTFAAALVINHLAMNDSKQGFHSNIVLNKQASDPTIEGPEAILFAKDSTSNAGTQPQLFVKIPVFLPTGSDTTIAVNDPMQLTYDTVNTSGTVTADYTIYQSFLIGKYLFYFGFCTNIAATITLSPSPSSLILAIASPNTVKTVSNFAPYDCSTQILTSSTFKINSTLNGSGPVNPYSFCFFAIGSA